MKLLSINVSLAKEVEYNDKIVSTGIFKQATTKSVIVNQTSLEGDQQVDLKNHGGEHKAVYGFAAEHYNYWRQQLAKPYLKYGQFGENLTISGLDEDRLYIGDRIQINDCILEITQPRVPCFKLGIALDQKDMPKRFVQHGATGIYFRVIQQGTISVNDSVRTVYSHPEKLTVQTLFNAYFDKSFENPREIMQRAANIAELSTEWREKVESRL
jgi:MOSC domain-containing protein YiiM